MSPSKFEDGEVTKGSINGPRPLPLRINKDSYAIHKSSHESNNDTSSHALNLPPKQQNPSGKQRQPVIIYTQSPKIIYAQAHDFMALVQKLTGFSRSEDEEKPELESKEEVEEKDSVKTIVGYEDNESSSVLTDEKYGGDQMSMQQESSAISPMYKMTNNPFLTDVPLFTPNSIEFFSSSRGPTSSLFQSPTMSNSISPPSFMDFMKGLPEY